MARAFLLVMDSLGIGGAPDADRFGDVGANTFGHIAQACADGKAEVVGVRSGPLNIPFLEGLGLGLATKRASGNLPGGLMETPTLLGQYGCASERSSGKDTISGHWEMVGLPVTFDWGYFGNGTDGIPPALLDDMVEQGELAGLLGICHASGTEIIAQHGDEHTKTLKPIIYTSADSVIQIAAHEEHFGLERLYELCEMTRKLVDPYNIGRVIARPFVGDKPDNYARTKNRHDYTVPPTGKTLLDRVVANGKNVHGVGKISDIFAGQGVSKKYPASGLEQLMQETIAAGRCAENGDMVFTNFVDFDMLYGHRRDVAGYAAELERFDIMLREFTKILKADDIVILTADHGNDPTWHGNDHTREQVPVLLFGHNVKPGEFGSHNSFSVIADTIGKHLGC